MKSLFRTLIVLSVLAAFPAAAFEVVNVTPRVYALVGDLGQRSPENLGHNMTSGFIIGDEAVAVVDSGASRAGAEAIHEAIRAVTDRPIRWVINTGGQDHRWLGNGYFRAQGAQVIASSAAAEDMRQRTAEQMGQAQRFIGEAFVGTEAAYPDRTFEERFRLPLEGVEAELIFTGGGHTPGDSFVWLPSERVVFTGDIVYAQRLLGVRDNGIRGWLASLRFLEALQPETVIPGHGRVTDLDEALRDTRDYLLMLKTSVQARIDEGAFDPVEASQGLDQSRFSYLHNYDDLRFRSQNALRVARELFSD